MAEREIAVIDLKSFYSFVECVDRGLDPFTTPLIVADKERGPNTIVMSVTPYLKSFGIPSVLRVKELPKKFNYIFATPRMSRYLEKSAQIVSIFMRFFDKSDIHVYSIDESFIDLTSYLKYYGKTSTELVKMIIDTIKEETNLVATAGVGDNFFLAKVALDIYAKHSKDGIAVMRKEDVPDKLWPITPLSKIWGIGSRLERRLNSFSIFTVQDLAFSNRDFIKSKLGIIGEQLIDHANGIDESDIHENYVPKETSFSLGQTLIRDYSKHEVPLLLKEMVDDLSLRLRNEEKMTSVVSLGVAYSKLQGGFSRQLTLLSSTDETEKLYDAIMEIYNKFIQDIAVRQLYISFGKLTDRKTQQLNIFEDTEKQVKKHNLQLAVDELHNRYGKDIITRASALLDESTSKMRHGQIGGHRK